MKKVFVILLSCVVLLSIGLFIIGCDGETDPEPQSNTIKISYYVENELNSFEIERGETNARVNCNKKGNKFLGLFDAREGGVKMFDEDGNQVYEITSNVTLYARFEKITYTKTFEPPTKGYMTDRNEPLKVKDGDVVTTLPNVNVAVGLEFKGWATNRNGTQTLISDGNMVLDDYMNVGEETANIWFTDEKLTAVIETAKYELLFYYNDDTYQIDRFEVEHGKPFNSIPVMHDDPDNNTEFGGWSTDVTDFINCEDVVNFGSITKSYSFYAYWRKWKTVNFVIDDNNVKTEKVYQDSPLTIPEYENPGYSLDYWCSSIRLDTKPIDKVYYSGQDTYYSSWTKCDYTIKFNPNNGSTMGDRTYQYGESFDLPTPEKENYTFVGWCASESLSDTPITHIDETVYGDKTFYAKWRGDDKKVIYNKNGGALAVSNKIIEYGVKTKLDVPVIDGYAFAGWYLDEQCTNAVTNKKGEMLKEWDIVNGETNLYAKFLKKYYVKISKNIGKAGEVELDEYYLQGERVAINVDVKEQYSFIGLYSGANVITTNTEYIFEMPESDVEFSLIFKANEYTITLDANGGYCSKTSVIVPYGEKYILPVAFKEQKKFIGWEYNGEFDDIVTNGEGESKDCFLFTGDVTLKAFFNNDLTNQDKLVRGVSDFLAIKDDTKATYQIVSDIDCSGFTWEMIDFSGKINGNGFTVSNIMISSASGNVALFNNFTGTISSLEFKDLSVSYTGYDVVSVAGIAVTFDGQINNVTVSGNVVNKYGKTGGFVAVQNGGTIKNSVNNANVSSASTVYENGVAGFVGYSSKGTVCDCVNNGNINGGLSTGGIVGIACNSCALEIRNLKNTGNVTGAGAHTGGICGYFARFGSYSISDFENSGTITGTERVGGIFGTYYNVFSSGRDSSVRKVDGNNFKNSGNVIATESYVGGIVGIFQCDAQYFYYSSSYQYDGQMIARMVGAENIGDVTGKYYVGGLYGYFSTDTGSSTIEESKSMANIEGVAYVGGLIGYTNNVQLLSLSNVNSQLTATGTYDEGTNKYAYVGGYVGRGVNTNISNATNNVEIDYSKTLCIGSYLGGIVGSVSGVLTDCTNNANIYAPKADYVGGIAGEENKSGSFSITNMSNSGNITGKGRVGGIFGSSYNVFSSGRDSSVRTESINATKNTGDIIGSENYVGGLVGIFQCDAQYYYYSSSYQYDGQMVARVIGAENDGNVTGAYYVGGLYGYFSTDTGSSEIIEGRSSAVVTAKARVGGLIGYASNVNITGASNKDTQLIATETQDESTAKYAYVGGYVGNGSGVNFSDVINEVEINYSDVLCLGAYVGGIIGRNSGTFTNCENKAKIYAPKSEYVGGIVGSNEKTGTFKLENLTNSGEITGKKNVGGLFGSNYNVFSSGRDGSVRTETVVKMSNSGNITAEEYVGGLVGIFQCDAQYYYYSSSYQYDGQMLATIQNLTNSGNVTGTKYVGGFMGYATTDSSSSQILIYSQTGAVVGTENFGDLMGYVSNIVISE